MTISGGTICVWTANTADNQPLDADGTITITGGTVLAAGGSAGMGMKLSVSQPYVTFGQSGSMQPRGGGADALISNGSTLAIWDETDTLFSMEAPCSARFVFYSSPELTEDGSYTLLSDGENAGTAEAQTGESQSGFGGMPGGRPGGFDSATNPRRNKGIEGSVLDDDTDFGPEGSGPSRVADLFLRNTESFFIFGGVMILLSVGRFCRTVS